MAPKKNSRRNRKAHNGGANESLNQGVQFRELLPQGGGAYTELHGAPVGDQGLLDGNLREMARVGPLDASIAAAAGMRDPDQSGGGRKSQRKTRKAARKGRKSERKSRKSERKSRKGRKSERKSRKSERKSRKSERKSRKAQRKGRKSERKGRKSERKGRKMFGGSASYAGAPIAQDSMLLSRADAARAGTADFSNPLLKH